MRRVAVAAIVAMIVLSGCSDSGSDPPTTAATTTSTVAGSTTTPAATTVPPAQVEGFLMEPTGGDDTAALVAAVTAHPVVVVDRPITVNNVANFGAVSDRTIRFVDSGSLVRDIEPTVRNFPVMVFAGGSNVVLDGVTIKGPGGVCDIPRDPPVAGLPDMIDVGYFAKWEAQHGIELGGVTNFVINGGEISDVHGDGVYIGAKTGAVSTGVTINDLVTECTGRSAVTNILSVGTTINGGTFAMSGLWIFNIEPVYAQTVHNYTITDATVGYSNFQWLFVTGPYFSCDVKSINVIRPNLAASSASRTPPKIAGCAASQVKVTEAR